MVLADEFSGFYQDLRWPGRQVEVAAIDADQGISILPFLFGEVSRPIAQASRRPVPLTELLSGHAHVERQAAGLSSGSRVRVKITGE